MKKPNFLIPVLLILVAVLAFSAAAALLFRRSPLPEPAPVPSPEPPVTAAPLPEPTAAPLPEPTAATEPTPEPEPEPAADAPLSPLYCTIWPVKDLEVYADVSKETVLGTAPASAMYCVLAEDEENALFRIRLSEGVYGYIDSNYCMIDLPEYIGGLCSYDITNSYASLYAIHEYEIPGLTGKLIPGYENVRLADGSFLVPFLYPCTPKLIAAARDALAAGYRIRICDSYRPRLATDRIYGAAVNILDVMLPPSTYSGVAVSLPPVPEPKEDELPRSYLVYRDLIEQGGWDIGAFLAPGWSQHNRGGAIDMTFEDARSGQAVTAQTNMHDLSAYSTIYSNNAAAGVILRLMEAHGLHNIVSEWWHFQDNELLNALKPPYCEKGVSAEGWIADAEGEMYRRADGSLVTDCVLVTEEGAFAFDAQGHRIP